MASPKKNYIIDTKNKPIRPKVKNSSYKEADISKKSFDEMIEPSRGILNSTGKIRKFLVLKTLLENVHVSPDCENTDVLIALIN